jgi:hypothetical protein
VKNYNALMAEIDAINRAWDYDVLAALQYIRDHDDEYRGTQVWNEFLDFWLGSTPMPLAA